MAVNKEASTVGQTELARSVKEAMPGLSSADAEKAVKAVAAAIQDHLVKGNKVSIKGFGTFYTRFSETRQGRNPGTGDAITIPAKTYAGFRAGTKLSVSLN